MRYIINNNYPFFRILLLTIILLSCKLPVKPSDNGDQTPDDGSIIPTTHVSGSGGPAYLAGNIRDYLDRTKPVSSTDLYIVNRYNYLDTILSVHINSTDATFLIDSLPLDTVDLIFSHTEYLSAKISALVLKEIRNSFTNPYSEGYFTDSTIALIAVADSVGQPNAPPSGIQGYGASIIVRFKMNIPDSLSLKIVNTIPYDTLRVFHYHDPVFDPEIGDVYDIIYPFNTKLLNYDRLLYFNWRKEVKSAGPLMAVVQS